MEVPSLVEANVPSPSVGVDVGKNNNDAIIVVVDPDVPRQLGGHVSERVLRRGQARVGRRRLYARGCGGWCRRRRRVVRARVVVATTTRRRPPTESRRELKEENKNSFGYLSLSLSKVSR